MSYTALYRKFRPSEFEDVKGQSHIITTLKNQVKTNRMGHAYLFCGTRGTGKTTVAKILGKAANCEEPIEGSPCGTCKMCVDISNGASLNVVEIDAASNNGVEHIRTINEEVGYRPASGKYRVYIIDEVHMLSTGAFNALLKTLEEPPEYVMFILATTELHKIPVTILSRCQHYEFKRITIDTISNRMIELMDSEKVEVEEKALRYIAKVADGSMRDALSILDQCIAFYMDEVLTYDKVLEVLGIVDTEVFSELMNAVISKDIVKVLGMIDELIMQGREITQLVNDYVWYMRNLLLVKVSEDASEVLDITSENLEKIKLQSEKVEVEEILRYIRIFSELSNQLKFASQRRILLEIAMIKMCKPQMEEDLGSVTQRVSDIEDKLSSGYAPQGNVVNNPSEIKKSVQKQKIDKAIPEEVKEVVSNFDMMINNVESRLLKEYLKRARVSLGPQEELLLVFSEALYSGHVSKAENIQMIKDAIFESIGKDVGIKIELLENNIKFDDKYEDLQKIVTIPIGVE